MVWDGIGWDGAVRHGMVSFGYLNLREAHATLAFRNRRFFNQVRVNSIVSRPLKFGSFVDSNWRIRGYSALTLILRRVHRECVPSAN